MLSMTDALYLQAMGFDALHIQDDRLNVAEGELVAYFLLDLSLFSKCLKFASDGSLHMDCRVWSRPPCPLTTSSSSLSEDALGKPGILSNKRRKHADLIAGSASSFAYDATQLILTSEREVAP